MTDRRTIVLHVLTAIITFAVVYEMVSLFLYNDYLTSLIPGRHASVYALGTVLRITLVVVTSSLITYVVYMLVLKFLHKYL